MTQELELLSAYIDGELTREEQDRINAFLASSAEGRQELEKILHTKSMMVSVPEIKAPEDFLDSLEAMALAKLEKPSLLARIRNSWTMPQVLVWGTSFASLAFVVGLWSTGTFQSPRAIPLETLLAAHGHIDGGGLHQQLIKASNDSSTGEPSHGQS